MRGIKNTYTFLTLMVIAFLLAACSESNHVNNNNDGEEMDSQKFFEEISMPDELSIDFDLDQVRQVKETKSYQAKPQEFDKEELVDLLIENPIVEENIWAEGPQVVASGETVDEVLNIDDGGEAFGIENDIFGFGYFKDVEGMDTNKLGLVANVKFHESSTLYDFQSNNDYQSKSDLEFSPFEEVYTKVEDTFNTIRIPIKADKAYSLDAETMKSHYESYPLDSIVVDEEFKNLTWTKEDEAYLFSLQELVDDIPIINKPWQMPDGTKTSAAGNPGKSTTMHVIYDQTGYRDVWVNEALKVTEEVENHSLISFYEALEKLVEAYSQTILEENVSIYSAELSYLPIPEDNNMQLIPGWVFRSTKTSLHEGMNRIEYKTDVVNAITGDLYQDRW